MDLERLLLQQSCHIIWSPEVDGGPQILIYEGRTCLDCRLSPHLPQSNQIYLQVFLYQITYQLIRKNSPFICSVIGPFTCTGLHRIYIATVFCTLIFPTSTFVKYPPITVVSNFSFERSIRTLYLISANEKNYS